MALSKREMKEKYKILSKVYRAKANTVLKALSDQQSHDRRMQLGYIFLDSAAKKYAKLAR